MAEFVSETLYCIRAQVKCVVDDVIMSGSDSTGPFPHRLTHNEKIVPRIIECAGLMLILEGKWCSKPSL